jgi:hypothetical protein
MLTEDDSFNSQPLLGNIAYRIPAANDLFGWPMEALDTQHNLHFTVSILAAHELLEEPREITCKVARNCRLRYMRSYTPTLYYLSPRVVYHSAYADLWFDPRSTPGLITGLTEERMLFINARVSRALIDFEFNVDHTTRFHHWAMNRVRGQIGELPIADNHTISMQWETGKARTLDHYATTCDIFNRTCYQAKTVPVIFDISDNVGYSSGGQNLTVKGHGFGGGNITATVDGANCVVTQFQDDSFSCEVQPKATISQPGLYPGSHGVRRSFYNTTNYMWHWSDFDTQPHVDSLLMDMQTPYSLPGDRMANRMKGYFVPPVTTRYRFYMSCDDQCRFELDTTNDPANLTLIMESRHHTAYRDYWDYQYTSQRQTISAWYTLTAGQKYMFQARQSEGTGGDHFVLSVEVEKTPEIPDDHHHAMKEIQYVEAKANGPLEVSTLTIDNVDAGQYRLVLFNARDSTKYNKTDTIDAKASAAVLKSKLESWFSKNAGSGISVERWIYSANGTDLNGNETAQDPVTNATLWTKSVYNITLTKYINGKSTSNVMAAAAGTTATITVEPSVVVSGAPLGGKLRLLCINAAGFGSYSEDFNYDAHENRVKTAIMGGCSGMREKVEVWKARGAFSAAQNGVGWYIRFSGKNNNPGQSKLESSNTTALTGDNVTFS